MASKELGSLTAATALSGVEEVYVVQSGNSRKSTTQAIADLGTSQDNMADGTTNKNYTATEQTKLAGIAEGAEVNVSPDWNATTGDGAIQNKPTLGTAAAEDTTAFATAEQGSKADTAVQPSQVREVLTANRTYYVATTGSDSNDGLTSGAAFKTIGKAIDAVAALDLGIYNATINVVDGTYAENIRLKSITGAGTASIVGNTGAPNNVLIQPSAGTAISISGASAIWNISGMKLAGVSGQIAANNLAVLNFGSIDLGACSGDQIIANSQSVVTAIDNFTISGGANRGFVAFQGGMIVIAGRTLTLLGTPAYSTVFANSATLALISCYSMTFVGAATGKRYDVIQNAVINTNGAGVNYLPGNVAGTSSSGLYA